ncbi:hypothetical protein QBC40DRAFT_63429 [Triangularia verruculosa]|uniref:Uncharacterized protein n=1 Tax=Triangularia verruculosa TaxID=2587418 RepID=A0AAN7AWK7_9PEZI|nr:hypothetical protein QBC40DRAFT_63429 [Triangularia verruculosa]
MDQRRARAAWSRRQRCQGFITRESLREGEFLTQIRIMTRHGDVVTLPRALVTPHYGQSYMPAATEQVFCHATRQPTARETHLATLQLPRQLTDEEVQSVTMLSPMGRLTSNRSLCVWFLVPQLSLPWILARFPVLDSELCRQRGVNMILGLPFINWYMAQNGLARPQRQPPYVFLHNDLAANDDQIQNSGEQNWMGNMALLVAEGGTGLDTDIDAGSNRDQPNGQL